MTERKIEALEFNGESIFIEVTEIEQVEGKAPSKKTKGKKDGFEKASTEEDMIAAGERVRSTISALAATIHQGLSKTSPSEWALEVNIGFKGKAGIPFIAEGEANGAVKVTAKWLNK